MSCHDGVGNNAARSPSFGTNRRKSSSIMPFILAIGITLHLSRRGDQKEFLFFISFCFSSKSFAASDGVEKRIYMNQVSILIFHIKTEILKRERDEWDARTRFSDLVGTKASGGKTRAMTENWLTSNRRGTDRKIAKSERIKDRPKRESCKSNFFCKSNSIKSRIL